MSKESIQALKDAVGFAGADWCGVQDTIALNESLLLFNSRETGSTLAVPFNPTDFEYSVVLDAVRKKLADSNAEFAKRRISVKVSTLERLRKTASELESELGTILGGESGKTNSGPETKRNL